MNVNGRTIRALAAATLLTTSVGSIGCGYLLYPERRGQQSGRIDSGTMVMDILWLLPGIVPGVIALVVDFSSGGIYVRGGTALRLSPDGHLAVRLPHATTPARLEFRLVTSSGRVLAQQTAFVGPSSPEGQSIDLDVGATSTREKITLEMRTETGASARFPTSLEVAFAK
jgi:hypothetical protein